MGNCLFGQPEPDEVAIVSRNSKNKNKTRSRSRSSSQSRNTNDSEISQNQNLESVQPSHNHDTEFEFWTLAFYLVDKSPDHSLQKDFLLSQEFNREKVRNDQCVKKGVEKLGFLNWSNIRGFGIGRNLQMNGYLKSLGKIRRLLDQVYTFDGKNYKKDLKKLIQITADVIDHRKSQLNPQSESYANHKIVLKNWKNLENYLEKVYLNKVINAS